MKSTSLSASRPVELTAADERPAFVVLDPTLPPDVACALNTVTEQATWSSLPVLASGRRTEVVLVGAGAFQLAVKRYTDRRGFFLRTFLRASRAEREARALRLVAEAFPANPVRVVAWAERRVAGFVPECWIATTHFAGSFDLRTLKRLEPIELQRAQAVIQEALPTVLAQLHAAGVFARSLRGKNVLLNPQSRRIGLIDLPYASRPKRLRVRQRVYDLACLWAELHRTLTAEAWSRLVQDYLQHSSLSPAEAAGVTPQAISRAMDRVQHRTPLASWISRCKRWFRHTRLGEFLSGFRYPERFIR